MRQRQIDRAILSESSSDPIDSEDQELIIKQFSADNNRRLRWSLRFLVIFMLAEMPLVATVAKSRLKSNQQALLMVSNVLVVLNSVFEFPEWSIRNGAGVRGAWRTCAAHVMSFQGVALLTAVVLLQLLFTLVSGPRTRLFFFAVPLVNLGMMVYVKKSHSDVQRDLRVLDSLRYKYKSA